MSQHTIEISTPRGTMPVHLHTPPDAARAPLVVLFMDALGIRPVLHEHAERLVAAGYIVALPDLFYFIDPADLPDVDRLRAGDQEEFKRMGAVVGQMDDAGVIADTRQLLDTVPSGEAPWGCVGFCMGGRYGMLAAEQLGESVAAASLLHPSRLVTDEPNSPHRHVEGISGALYLGFGENDHVTPVSTIPPLQEELDRNGIAHTIDVLADADHGYTMPGMPAYNEVAAERAWARTLALFSERLGSAH